MVLYKASDSLLSWHDFEDCVCVTARSIEGKVNKINAKKVALTVKRADRVA